MKLTKLTMTKLPKLSHLKYAVLPVRGTNKISGMRF